MRASDQYGEIVALIGSLAHEIKNPLSTIRLNLELLAEDFRPAESLRERRAASKISVVQRECQRLQDLLDDFLKVTRVRRLDLEPSDLNAEVTRALDFFRPQADEARSEVILYLEPDLPSVLLDLQAFQAALLNLLLNAQQAMEGGGQLVVRSRVSAGRVALDLIDTGCGMDEKTLARAFEVFFSTKQGGSGLGLPTTRKIIEAHGGCLLVQSEVGRGTQFTIELPPIPRIAPAPPPPPVTPLPA
ncbi:MAG: sensor histidine kinase [Planctomycetia bacterium]|nr:sensor histidine kinase [Planctomycetia bacterium]